MALSIETNGPARRTARNHAIRAAVAAALSMGTFAVAEAATPPPVFVHMNGANEFLERLVFVQPGQKVVFVNEDTGPHAVQGYNPATGTKGKRFDDPALMGTPGTGHQVHTYSISFAHQGVHWYYCPVHADLVKAPGDVWWPKVRHGVHGFGTPMAGIVVVTTNKPLLADNPSTASRKILPKYFGG